MPVRARDVRVAVGTMGFEKGVVHILELLCEDLVGHRETQKDMAEVISLVASNVERMISVGTSMSDKLADMERKDKQWEGVQSEKPLEE